MICSYPAWQLLRLQYAENQGPAAPLQCGAVFSGQVAHVGRFGQASVQPNVQQVFTARLVTQAQVIRGDTLDQVAEGQCVFGGLAQGNLLAGRAGGDQAGALAQQVMPGGTHDHHLTDGTVQDFQEVLVHPDLHVGASLTGLEAGQALRPVMMQSME